MCPFTLSPICFSMFDHPSRLFWSYSVHADIYFLFLPFCSPYYLLLWLCFLIFYYNSFGCLFFLSFFFFLRKISPELTTANPPLFAEEDWPWSNIHAHLLLLCMWDAYHSMAFAKQCQVQIQDLNQRTLGRWKAECANLTTVPPGWPLSLFFYGGRGILSIIMLSIFLSVNAQQLFVLLTIWPPF